VIIFSSLIDRNSFHVDRYLSLAIGKSTEILFTKLNFECIIGVYDLNGL
jgi:hypothetical protein